MRELLSKNLSLIFPALICASVVVIIAPLPPALLDVLISANITLSVLILLATIYVRKPLELSVFPTILLATTLSRLVLNVASTRLILTGAADRGTEAAGGVIAAFGDFVAGGSPAVGLILFAVLIAIQWLVVTKGSTRISEVAARFALDGMPGKQMAIDADLNAKLIDGEEAKRRRAEVSEQADFYAAMDGASKFVRGDAVAGLVITAINVIGGLYIGVFENGMSFAEAGSVFTTLTIGDGLVTQVPTFLVSVAAGLIVTRTSAESNLQVDIVGQLFQHPMAMYMASTFLAAIAFTGLPMAPLLTLSVGCAFVGFTLSQTKQKKQAQAEATEADEKVDPKERVENPEEQLRLDEICVELGRDLGRLTDPSVGGTLIASIPRLRNRIARELGFILPDVRCLVLDRPRQSTYEFQIRGVPVADGQLMTDGMFAIDNGNVTREVPGIDAIDPAFGQPARWIEPAFEGRALSFGYDVVDPTTVLVTHLREIVRDHASEILTLQHTRQLVKMLGERAPELVDEIVPDVLKLSLIHQVLRLLLRERVPIRDLETIMETLGVYGERLKEPALLTEYVRHSLGRTLCKQYRDSNRVLHAITLESIAEETLGAGIDFGESGVIVKLSPESQDAFRNALAVQIERMTTMGLRPILVTGPQYRAGLRQIASNRWPRLVVLSTNELTRDTELESHGQVSLAAIQAQLHPAARGEPVAG